MMIKILSFIIGIFMSVLSFFGMDAEQPAFVLNAKKLDRRVSGSQEARIESGELTGSQVMVNQFNESVLNKTYGTKTAGGEGLKEDAVYRIASMTKPVCAVAMLIAYQDGLVDIYADVADYLPAYKEMQVAVKDKQGNVSYKKAENSIKVYMLVSHISGLLGDTDVEIYKDIPGGKNLENVAAYLATQPLQFEPGTNQTYCTEAFDVMARIIEIQSGMEFGAYIREKIFDKLGMTDTGFEPTREQWDRMVAIHAMENGRAVDLPAVQGCLFGNNPVTYHGAGACLFSTAGDYMKFAQMLLNNGKSESGEQILTEESVQLLKTPVVDDDIMSGSQKWGLGVRVITDNNYTLPKGCFGWSGAYGTHFWIDPANKICAVYMKNSAYDGGAGAKTANELEEDLMGSFSVKMR